MKKDYEKDFWPLFKNDKNQNFFENCLIAFVLILFIAFIIYKFIG